MPCSGATVRVTSRSSATAVTNLCCHRKAIEFTPIEAVCNTGPSY